LSDLCQRNVSYSASIPVGTPDPLPCIYRLPSSIDSIDTRVLLPIPWHFYDRTTLTGSRPRSEITENPAEAAEVKSTEVLQSGHHHEQLISLVGGRCLNEVLPSELVARPLCSRNPISPDPEPLPLRYNALALIRLGLHWTQPSRKQLSSTAIG
jgi:hypothetical protein